MSMHSCPHLLAALLVAGLTLGTAAGAGNPGKPTKASLEEKLQAKDFWPTRGVKLQHPDINGDDLTKLIDSTGNVIVRIRACKLLVDLAGNSRFSADVPAGQTELAVAAAFAHLERNLGDKTIQLYRPDFGFTHLTVSRRNNDADSVWVLIETADANVPGSGLNLLWNARTEQVDQVQHWGAVRKR